MSIASTNPYANHPELSNLEGEVLWEFAKLGDKIKQICTLAREASEKPNDDLLKDLRELERKMTLVYGTYRSAVYNATRALLDEEEAQAAAQATQQPSPRPEISFEIDDDTTVTYA